MLLVRVPAAVVDGDVGHAALDQTPRDQAGLAEPGECRLAPRHVAVPASQRRILLRQIEHLGAVAQDHVVGLLLRFVEGRQVRVAFGAAAEGVELAEQVAAILLLLVGDALGDDAFHHEPGLRRIAAGGEGFVSRPQETGLGEPPLRLGQHDVGREQALVAGVVALEQRDHGAGAGIDQPIAGAPAGLRQVGRRLVAVVAVGHAADDGVLVGLLGQHRQQLADPDPVHVGLDRFDQRTAVVVARLRLRIEGVQVRRAAPPRSG